MTGKLVKDGKEWNGEQISVLLYFRPHTAPILSEENNQIGLRKAGTVEYNVELERRLTELGAENPEANALLFASGAEKVDIQIGTQHLHYKKADDTASVNPDLPSGMGSVRELTYRLLWWSDDETGRVYARESKPLAEPRKPKKRGWLASWFGEGK